MKYQAYWEYFSLVRSLVFLLVAFESYFLARLYRMACKEMKGTPIINAMQIVFFAISVMFTFLTIVAFNNRQDNVYSEPVKAMLIIPALMLLKALSSFRIKSLEEQVKVVSGKIREL